MTAAHVNNTSLHTEHLTHPRYRADIDGLRALAILSVVGFHAFPSLIEGGFIGVDVFFVISGFLISTIIIGSLERNSFGFIEFYGRRIKRIFPALLLVLIASFAFGWFVLFADEYKHLGKHIAGGAGFISNFLLWNESGYFDNAAETKPLLHLWSLGIEEQFYIIWPLFLWFTWKLRLNLLTIAISVGIVSFAMNINAVGTDAVAAFYSPQTRFWELMVGSVLAYTTRYKQGIFHNFKQLLCAQMSQIIYAQTPEKNDRALRNTQSIFGAALIAIGILLITKDSQFPGWWAVFPTLGTLLVISAGTQAWLNRVVLSNRVLVWFGLISYPLYLWHWPLLSFARIVEGKAPSSETLIGAVLISISFAWLTYKLIEKPIRFGKYREAIIPALIVLMSVVGLAGYKCFASDGFESRPISKAALDLAYDVSKFKFFTCPNDLHDSNNHQAHEFCSKSSNLPATFAIIGDSFANDKFYGIANLDKDHSWLLAGKAGRCPPIYGIEIIEGCLKRSEKTINWIANNSEIKTVVLSFIGRDYLDIGFNAAQKENKWSDPAIRKTGESNRIETFSDGLEFSIRLLEESGKSVIILLPPPYLGLSPRDCLRKPLMRCELNRNNVLQNQLPLRTILGSIVQIHQKVRVFDPIDLFCDQERCSFSNGEIIYFYDGKHLSLRGSDYYAAHFLKWLHSSRHQ